jgi:cytochrome c2
MGYGLGVFCGVPAGVILLVFGLPLLVSSACSSPAVREAETLTGGSVTRGRSAVGRYGCAACHTIPGIDGATANVGPPLDNVALRPFLGGHLPNTPDNMVRWIQHPQSIDPKNVMPKLGVTDQDARDLTAFLYTLR